MDTTANLQTEAFGCWAIFTKILKNWYFFIGKIYFQMLKYVFGPFIYLFLFVFKKVFYARLK